LIKLFRPLFGQKVLVDIILVHLLKHKLVSPKPIRNILENIGFVKQF